MGVGLLGCVLFLAAFGLLANALDYRARRERMKRLEVAVLFVCFLSFVYLLISFNFFFFFSLFISSFGRADMIVTFMFSRLFSSSLSFAVVLFIFLFSYLLSSYYLFLFFCSSISFLFFPPLFILLFVFLFSLLLSPLLYLSSPFFSLLPSSHFHSTLSSFLSSFFLTPFCIFL